MTNVPNKWEIWRANVRFEEDASLSKERPVLIINPESENKIAFALTCYITSKPPRPFDDMDYDILKWREAGLDGPSTIRLNKRIEIKKSSLLFKVGKLKTYDILQITQKIGIDI